MGGSSIFERFTDRGRRVIVLAQEEARLRNHNFIDTVHLLLGLIQEQEGIAALALSKSGISYEGVSAFAAAHDELNARRGHIPFMPEAKRVLEQSLREALQLGHNYIGTEHLLLSAIKNSDCLAAQAMSSIYGEDLSGIRLSVIQILSTSLTSPAISIPTTSHTPTSGLFASGQFTLHSGEVTEYKIDCDHLSESDLATIAHLLSQRVGPFSRALGIPEGGHRLEHAMQVYASSDPTDPILLVDDVMTTGSSMEEWRKRFTDCKGAVIFSRPDGRVSVQQPIPDWITVLFRMADDA